MNKNRETIVLTSTISNQNMIISEIDFPFSNTRSVKKGELCTFTRKNTNEILQLPISKLGEFVIDVAESYVRYDSKFSSNTYRITIEIIKI